MAKILFSVGAAFVLLQIVVHRMTSTSSGRREDEGDLGVDDLLVEYDGQRMVGREEDLEEGLFHRQKGGR